MRNAYKCIPAFFLIWLSTQFAWAQQSLQSPEQFLGYKLGKQFTTHNRVLDYVNHVAAQVPKRIKVQEYGKTYEGRPLILAYVASEENLTRLDQIRENNLKIAGVTQGQPQGNQPAIVWLSYNIHGNESVSTEAMMQVLYELANTSNTQTQSWLKKYGGYT